MPEDFKNAKNKDLSFKWEHLSLCVLEVFFENELESKASVKPLIQRYIDIAKIPMLNTLENIEDFKEWTNSDLLDSINSMDAQKREQIFGQKNLSSLVIFVEMFVKSGLEKNEDVQKIANDDQKVYIFRKVMEKKGYINKFVDLTMREIFKRSEKVKRKDNNEKASPNAQKPALGVVKGLEIKEFRSKSRNIQLFPPATGAFSAAIGAVVSFVVTVICFMIGSAKLASYSSQTSMSCLQIKAQAEAIASNPMLAGADDGSVYQGLCTSNTNAQFIAYILLIVGSFIAVLFILFFLRLLKITLHNSFARTHNQFEMVHHTFE